MIELPWVLHQLSGHVLDAGAALHHAHVLRAIPPRVTRLDVATLAPEEPLASERGALYAGCDLRELPFADSLYDAVVSVSTLEHIGMDNRPYGIVAPRAEDPSAEMRLAVGELRRVLRPGGALYATVPFGIPEDHGWFRQFCPEDVEELVSAFGGAVATDVRVYAYHREGWQASGLESASRARYRNRESEGMFAEDRAAAARAVACVRLVSV